MIKIVVVDRSAESRSRIVAQIGSFLRADTGDLSLLPQVSLKPLAPQELKFHGAPDICIVGEEIVASDLTEIGAIRKLLPNTALLVRITGAQTTLSIVEQIARMGADDTLSDTMSAPEFLRKIVLLARKIARPKTGTLVLVDSGKGGVGVTSVAAALGEGALCQGKRVLLIDLDFETQDMSRFLQARPFINENLQLLLGHQRPVTQEFVEQCIVQVWQDEPNFCCMPPAGESDDLYDSRAPHARTLLSVLEVVDSLFDCVVIDMGSVRGAMQKALYRVADKVVFLVNNDPATLYASVDKLSRVRPLLAPAASLLVVENSSQRTGLSNHLLRDEFSRAARLDGSQWYEGQIPFCREGCKWPGSGATPYSGGKDGLVRSLQGVLERLSFVPTSGSQPLPGRALTATKNLLGRYSGARGVETSVGEESTRAKSESPLLERPALQIEDHGIRFTRRGANPFPPAGTERPDPTVPTGPEDPSEVPPLISHAEVSRVAEERGAEGEEALSPESLISRVRVA